MTDEQRKDIIEAYFRDPKTRELMRSELGFQGRIEVDWVNRTVKAQGFASGREWDLDDLVNDLVGLSAEGEG